MRRIKVFTSLIQGNLRPEWMVTDNIAGIIPDLRPLFPLEGGRFASSDLNELSRRVLNRNIRLQRLIEIEAPSVIIKNEKRMLQESVDALIDNGRRGQPVRGPNRRPLNHSVKCCAVSKVALDRISWVNVLITQVVP